MKRLDTDLPGVCLIEANVFSDARGDFFESWRSDKFAELGIDAGFAQCNVSHSAHGVLRGLHYQWPQPQGKLVSVLRGEVYDVAVDIRPDSPTFKRHFAAVLSEANHRQLWVPEGFAHGFAVLSDDATVAYLCTALYRRDADAGIRWNDAAFAIDWPLSAPLVSDKDAAAPFLADVPADRLPHMECLP